MIDIEEEQRLVKAHNEFGIDYLPTPTMLVAALGERYKDLPSAETREGYEANRIARGELTKIRTAVEKRRKELKADSLAYGRRIDGFANFCTVAIEQIETPIRNRIAAVDNAKELARAAAEAAEKAKQEEEARQRIREEESRLKVIRDVEDARLKNEREALAAERAKLEAEQQAERNRIDAERVKLEAEQKAERRRVESERLAVEDSQRIEREKLAEAKRIIDAERQRLERIEFERQAEIKAEQEAIEKAERRRIEAERLAAEQAKAEAVEEERAEKMRSDVERVAIYAKMFADFTPPTPCVSREANQACQDAYHATIAAGRKLAAFAPPKTRKEKL